MASNEFWIVLSLILTVNLLILYRNYAHRLGLSFRALYSRRHLTDLYVDDQVFSFRSTFFLNLHIIVLLFTIPWLMYRHGLQLDFIPAWKRTFTAVQVIFYYTLLRSGIIFVLALLSEQKASYLMHLYKANNIRCLWAIFLTPVVLLSPLLQPETFQGFFIGIVVITAIGLGFRWWAGLKWLQNNQLSNIEILLYFCALELIPFGIGLRFLLSQD
ncbi:MAG: hypothetical protein ACJAY8_001126 [Sphingobacteriales bacterium]|jgi:hypothetical protein